MSRDAGALPWAAAGRPWAAAGRAWAAAGLAVAVLAGAALAQGPAPAGSGDLPMSPGRRFGAGDGAALYRQSCAGCHMPDGRGAVGAGAYPALADNPKLESASYPVTVVVAGLRGMPAVGRLMSDEQVAAVVTYVRTHLGNAYPDAVTAADVAPARP